MAFLIEYIIKNDLLNAIKGAFACRMDSCRILLPLRTLLGNEEKTHQKKATQNPT
jgi:hypothetical protein